MRTVLRGALEVPVAGWGFVEFQKPTETWGVIISQPVLGVDTILF